MGTDTFSNNDPWGVRDEPDDFQGRSNTIGPVNSNFHFEDWRKSLYCTPELTLLKLNILRKNLCKTMSTVFGILDF
jgi:hypothetical protein